ncbi:hypothetical protein EYF80_057350 [Liparis tanakae]|uniref:Uncharacterized protein n=1 Tax=Liparis tanakae TaxID=230148 RepID=A0A4Z2EUJ9_9TELE|nr:hypothetical protein EYF80_057350 [Liparis tanakae]
MVPIQAAAGWKVLSRSEDSEAEEDSQDGGGSESMADRRNRLRTHGSENQEGEKTGGQREACTLTLLASLAPSVTSSLRLSALTIRVSSSFAARICARAASSSIVSPARRNKLGLRRSQRSYRACRKRGKRRKRRKRGKEGEGSNVELHPRKKRRRSI